jgi:hypothetical protein
MLDEGTARLHETAREVRHSMDTDWWFTPEWVLDGAREALGGEIDLDPASCALANESVRARVFFSAEDNGMTKPWADHEAFAHDDVVRCWHNPPSPAREWWNRISTEAAEQPRFRAVYLAYNVQQICAFVGGSKGPGRWAVCLLRERVRFRTPAWNRLLVLEERIASGKKVHPNELAMVRREAAENPDALITGEQPAHHSAIVGLNVTRADFARAWAIRGDVVFGERCAA